jgi:zinc/manganese transport system substrate-binding protein
MKEKTMTSKLKLALIGALLAGTSLAASSGIALAKDKIKVVASFSILGDFVQKVGGDQVEVTTIVGPDGDAHVYEPKPNDAKAMAAAQVVFFNSLAFEGWLDRLVESSGYKGKLVKSTDGIKLKQMDGEPDPHAWQSAVNAQIYVKNIAEALCVVEKPDCDVFKANAEAYSKELAAVNDEIKTAVGKIPENRRTVITSHDAFGYFSQEYGITFLAPEGLSTESEASAKDVAKLIEQIREDKASAIFVENISDPRLVEQIASETGLRIGGALYSDALSSKDGPAPTYVDMMKHNARLLTEAMTGS